MTENSRTTGTTLADAYPEEFMAREAAILAAGEHIQATFRDTPLDLSATMEQYNANAGGLPEFAERTFRYSFREGVSTLLPDLGDLGRLIWAAIRIRLGDGGVGPVSAFTPLCRAEEPVRVSNARTVSLPSGTSVLVFDFQATLFLRGPGSLESIATGAPEENGLRVRGTGTLAGGDCLLVPESMTARV